MRRAALALMPLLAALVACASGERPTVGVPEAPAGADAGTEPELDAGSDAASDAGDAGDAGTAAAPPEPKPDPSLVKLALDRTGQPVEISAAPYGLRFEVVEQGPELSWAYAVVNRGSERVSVALDPRLLRLEVEPAPPEEEPVTKGKRRPKAKPKPKKRDCALPEGIRPAKVDKKLVVELAPGEGAVEAFDPRLYCLPVDGKSSLQPGAVVTAHFGWPVKTKAHWRKGKKVEEPLPQRAPFVAMPAESSKTDAQKNKPSPEDDLGVKELVGTPLTLGGDYASKPPPSDESPPPIEVVLQRGSDAKSEETATVTVQIKNRSKEKLMVFFRRELVSFEVSGPDGRVTCDPQPDTRAPDRQAFRGLGPGASITTTSRLIELCPDDTFARPGLYLAYARFDANATGGNLGLDAITGKFASEKPAIIRIRTGELPFLGRRVMERVKVGETK